MFYCLLFFVFMAWRSTISTFHIMSKFPPFYDFFKIINPYLVLIPLPFMTCFNICKNFPPKKKFAQSWYNTGNKRCVHCNRWLKWDGGFIKKYLKDLQEFLLVYVPYYRCPCCNRKIRMHPRSLKHKENYRKNLALIIKGTNSQTIHV